MTVHEGDSPERNMKPDPFTPIPGRCNARKTDGSGLCRHGAGRATPHPGEGHCSKHGGCVPNQIKHVAAVRAEAELGAAAARWGVIEPEWDARGRLAYLLGYARALVRWLEGKVAELTDEELIWGVTSHREGTGPEGPVDVRVREAAKHAWVVWLNEERDREHRLALDCAKLGIEERRVQVQEDALSAMVAALTSALEVGIAAGSVDVGREELFTQMRVLTAAPVETQGRPL